MMERDRRLTGTLRGQSVRFLVSRACMTVTHEPAFLSLAPSLRRALALPPALFTLRQYLAYNRLARDPHLSRIPYLLARDYLACVLTAATSAATDGADRTEGVRDQLGVADGERAAHIRLSAVWEVAKGEVVGVA